MTFAPPITHMETENNFRNARFFLQDDKPYLENHTGELTAIDDKVANALIPHLVGGVVGVPFHLAYDDVGNGSFQYGELPPQPTDGTIGAFHNGKVILFCGEMTGEGIFTGGTIREPVWACGYERVSVTPSVTFHLPAPVPTWVIDCYHHGIFADGFTIKGPCVTLNGRSYHLAGGILYSNGDLWTFDGRSYGIRDGKFLHLPHVPIGVWWDRAIAEIIVHTRQGDVEISIS